jgi:hypothetical protein
LHNVEEADGRTVNQNLPEERNGVAALIGVLRVSEAIDKDLMEQPSLVVHAFLVTVSLLGEKLLDEVLHLSEGGKLKSLLFSLKENLAVQKAPEDLETEVSLAVLFSSEDLLKGEQVLFGIYNWRVFSIDNHIFGINCANLPLYLPISYCILAN